MKVMSETFELEKENKHSKTDGILLPSPPSPLTTEKRFTSHERTHTIFFFFIEIKSFFLLYTNTTVQMIHQYSK